MKRKPSPQEKKRLRYAKDFFNAAEYPHAFRVGWPRKKARANRKFRREVHELLRGARHVSEERVNEVADDRPITRKYIGKSIPRERPRKWGVITLREKVAGTLEDRIQRIARNYFKEPYDPNKHRRRFSNVLTAIVEGRTDSSAKVAHFLREMLGPSDPGSESSFPYRRQWLRSFFSDEPEWEERLLAWIRESAATASAVGSRLVNSHGDHK